MNAVPPHRRDVRFVDRAVATVKRLLPRHRRWQRLLASLTLDPDHLAHPVPEPGTHDFVICGPPRSGTSLATAALYQPPRVVTVMEPWDGLRLPPAELFASLRAEIAETGRLQRGRLDISALSRSGQVTWCGDGEQPHAVDTARDHLLGVKWPAFWRYLDLLPRTKFVVCLRNPAEVISSFRRQPRLAQGLEYDVAFNRRMNDELAAATDDPTVRQVLFLDHVCRAIAPHLDRPSVFALRYERWGENPAALLDELSEFLDVDVRATLVSVEARPPREIDRDIVDLINRHAPTLAAFGADLGYDL